MTKNVTLKSLRPRLPKIIADVDSKMDRFIITKRGRPVALLMAVDDYESILETLGILSDARLARRIKNSEREIKSGGIKALDRIEKEMGLV